MANTTQGTVWNLPNYSGELFTSDQINTPFLTMIGGLSGGGMITDNFEFPTDQQYDHEAAAQPAITETASLTAPAVISYVRAQAKNVCQIFHETVSLTYERMANQGRLSGINTAGQANAVPSELDFQIAKALEKIARDIDYTCINGAYSIAANAGQANKTRGLLELCTVNTVAGGSAYATKAMIDALLLEMYTNGALFKNVVLWCNGFQKQVISDIYGYAPTDRNVGGVNIKQIETDFGNIGIMLDRFMPTTSILLADMALIKPVFQPVPEKGNFFYEELARTGAAVSGQIFGKFGLDHGPSFAHGSLTGLLDA